MTMILLIEGVLIKNIMETVINGWWHFGFGGNYRYRITCS